MFRKCPYVQSRERSHLFDCKRLFIVGMSIFLWAHAVQADEFVPFAARLAGFAAPQFNPDGTITNVENAAGEATHLGKFTWMSEETATFTGPNSLAVTGSFTMTAANGDQVYGTYETAGTVNFPIGLFVGEYVIKGGTGRFAKATGGGTIIGIGNLQPPFEIVGSLTGSISRPNH
jgi:hypothetical protein